MKIEVDQSGKIEQTNKPTIIAFTNGIASSIKISAKTKRQLQEIFRRQGKPQLFIYTIFAIGLFLLVEDHLKDITVMTVDTEYIGHEILIRDIIFDLIRRSHTGVEPTIRFARIGRRPKVHYAAHDVFVKKKKPAKTLSFTQIFQFLSLKMTEVAKD